MITIREPSFGLAVPVRGASAGACPCGATAALWLALLAACAHEPASPPSASPDPRLLVALRGCVPIDPPGLAGDPYATWSGRVPPPPRAGAACGVRFEADQVHYRLATFESEGAAREAGFAVTHLGACGTCSTLQDLAVYLAQPDLTTPVRRCGIMPGETESLACLERLGFSHPCARTWFFNTRNTRRECFGVCVWDWIEGEPSTDRQGRLNPCLQCDEDRSGPVFKATAGRTRRNSGIRSSIPRPEEDVARVVHDYVPGVPRH